ncbi:MAG: ribonuclease E/G [Clostridium sp.]|nr:ribonuclease E/G [Clostridium sp.]
MVRAVITEVNQVRCLFLYENDKLAECHPFAGDAALRLGSIYIGRVEKVVKNIQSAFIRLDKEHVGYLPLNDKPAVILNRQLPKGLPSIAEGDSILVQVEQEPQKMKQAKVTGNISLSGDYTAIDLMEGSVGVSKKITDKERNNYLRSLAADHPQYGIVFRTACEKAEDAVILAELQDLTKQLDEILKRASYEKMTGMLYEGDNEYLAVLEEYGMTRLDEIKTDLPDVYAEISRRYGTEKAVFYDEEYPLVKLFSLETELSHILNKKVWLKSGGFLVIEPTEAMVVIDVNSGKSIGKKNKDAHILKLNLEAAQEITRQLRLRNLSGIIMIDFINMQTEEDRQQVVRCLEKELKKDKVPGYFVEITRLGVFELTRKKIRRPLHEVITSL